MTRSAARPTWARGGREQVLPGDAPQDLSLGPRGDAGREKGCRRTIDGGIASAGDLVQCPKRQPAAWKSAVDGIQAEWEDRAGAQRRAFKTLNLLTEPPDGGWLGGDTHGLINVPKIVCS